MKRLFSHRTPYWLDRLEWRDYQRKLSQRQRRRRLLAGLIISIGCVLLFYAVIRPLGRQVIGYAQSLFQTDKPQVRQSVAPPGLSLPQVRALLKDNPFFTEMDRPVFSVLHDNRPLLAQTGLDMDLQHDLQQQVQTRIMRPRACPLALGIVVMQPQSGRVLAMVGRNGEDRQDRLCAGRTFPAASVFKIVTAAAAVGGNGFSADSVLAYNGGKHTLYKSQLVDKHNRFTQRISLRRAFAQSINPVFGKLGSLYLGQSLLQQYSRAFGFNQSIGFETPLTPSHIEIGNDSYQLAEIASGFNRQTTLSVLHAALLAAAVLNQGRLPMPALITQINDGRNGPILYQSRPQSLGQAMSADTADQLQIMMRETICCGTARKTFRRGRDQLKNVNMGGKTGSIGVDPRYDWFVGFARDEAAGREIAMAIMVAHEKYIGTRSMQYAKLIMQDYFQSRQAAQTAHATPVPGA